MTTVLLVPVEGPLRVVPSAPDQVEALLKQDTEGRYVDFGVVEGPQSVNMRARHILAELTGVHMVITGTAAFHSLPDERFQQLLADHG
jgi:hypothetical protein